MARDTGSGRLGSTYNVKGYTPLDTRQLVPTYADLKLETNWKIDGNAYTYNGMFVVVGSDSDATKCGIYRLYDAQNPGKDDEPNITLDSSWHKVAELSDLANLSDKATVEAIAARVTALENASGGVDEDAVNALIAAQLDALKTELAGVYATKEELGTLSNTVATKAAATEITRLEGLIGALDVGGNIAISYATTTSLTTDPESGVIIPSSDSFSADLPPIAAGQYLWIKIDNIKDGSVTSYYYYSKNNLEIQSVNVTQGSVQADGSVPGTLTIQLSDGSTKTATIKTLRGLQGEQGEQGPAGPQGPQGPEGPEGPQGPQGPQGNDGANGKDGKDGAAATINIGTVSTGAAGSIASVTNVGSETDAVLNFTIPQGVKGEQGAQGPQGPAGSQGPAGPQGPEGSQGPAGPQGPMPVITAAANTGAAGTAAQVTVTETADGYNLSFTIPKGDTGELPENIQIVKALNNNDESQGIYALTYEAVFESLGEDGLPQFEQDGTLRGSLLPQVGDIIVFSAKPDDLTQPLRFARFTINDNNLKIYDSNDDSSKTSIYVPTTKGSINQILKSDGDATPSWVLPKTLTITLNDNEKTYSPTESSSDISLGTIYAPTTMNKAKEDAIVNPTVVLVGDNGLPVWGTFSIDDGILK